MPTFHLLIKGKVQGVFYRESARKEAVKLGITGWISNLPDGDVEAVITGALPALEQFLTWCKKGPMLSKVAEVLVTQQEEQPFEMFTVKRQT